jgi:hypothetical protein
MSTFYIGQRVRIVGCLVAREALGREATVLSGPADAWNEISGEWVGYHVSVDGIGPICPRGNEYCFRPDFMEPIVPDGLESREDIERLWLTEPCEADV